MIDKTQIQTLYWDEKHTIKEIAKELDISFWALYNLRNKRREAKSISLWLFAA